MIEKEFLEQCRIESNKPFKLYFGEEGLKYFNQCLEQELLNYPYTNQEVKEVQGVFVRKIDDRFSKK